MKSIGAQLEEFSARDLKYREDGIDRLREELSMAGSILPAAVRKSVEDLDPVPVAKGDHLTLARLALMLWSWSQAGGDRAIGCVPPVFSLGTWWVYHYSGKFKGTWRETPKSTAHKCVTWLPAAAVWKNVNRDGSSSDSPLRVNKAVRDGVCALMETEAGRDDFFDRPVEGMCFTNGFLDHKLELHEHHESQLSRFKVDYEWDPTADSTNWVKFLDSVWEGEADLEERKRALGQWLGGTLLGRATLGQRAIIMLGKGSNGKSVLADAVTGLFSREDVACVSPQDLGADYSKASLMGVKINVVADVSARELIHSGDIKMVINGDQIKGRHPYGREMFFNPIAGHLFSCNELPRTIDLSDGFFRRWIFLSFSRKFGKGLPGSRPPEELNKELRDCRSGIAAWAIKHYVEGGMRGLFVPKSSERIRSEWRSGSDQIVQFVMECCLPLDSLDNGKVWVSSKSLYDKYKEWAREANHKTCSAPTFSKRMVEAELPNGYKVMRGRSSTTRGFNLNVRMPHEPLWEEQSDDSGNFTGQV